MMLGDFGHSQTHTWSAWPPWRQDSRGELRATMTKSFAVCTPLGISTCDLDAAPNRSATSLQWAQWAEVGLMRLLFLSNFYPPVRSGGYDQLCQDVARTLEARGHTLSVLTSRQ